MIKYFIALSVFVSILIAQTTESECVSSIAYPEWFLFPPVDCIQGFPVKNKSAYEDGIDRFQSFQRMRAHGILRFYEENGGLSNSQDSLYFYYVPDTIRSHTLIANDSVSLTKGHTVFLYSLDSSSSSSSKTMNLCSAIPWKSENEQSDRTYAIGISKFSYYDHIVSWVGSESDAIRELLRKSAVLVASLQSGNENDLREVTRYEYDLDVRGIRVERRWVDLDDNICYVAVSVPKGSIASWKELPIQPKSTEWLELYKKAQLRTK